MTEGTFGPYRLLSRLGTGGMGQVWRAVDTRKGREVALKLIRSDLDDRDFAARFHREAELAARLTSPYLVAIHDYGEIEGQLFLDMALIEGDDLGRLILQEGALPPGRAVTLASQVARALGVAHRAGLVHRDVKPSNVLVADDDGDDHAYLIDFGLARRLEGTQLTRAGTLLGTLSYMAPERFRGPGDRRGDVYALACMLYEALTGQPPFTASSTPGIIYAHLRTPPPRVSERAGVPAALDAVIARGLAKDPADRFADAGELAAAARVALGGAPPAQTRQAGPADAPTARTPLAGPDQETSPPPRDSAGVPPVGEAVAGVTAPTSPGGDGVAPDPGSTATTPHDVGAHLRSQAVAATPEDGTRPAGDHDDDPTMDSDVTRPWPGPGADGSSGSARRIPPSPTARPHSSDAGVTQRLPSPAGPAAPVGGEPDPDSTHRFPGRRTSTPPREAAPDVTHRIPNRTGPRAPGFHDGVPARALASRTITPLPRDAGSGVAGSHPATPGPASRPPPGRTRRRRLRTAVLVMLAAVVGAGLVAWIWTGQQYYVGASGDRVVVYQGVRGSVLGLPLSQVAEDTGIRTADLQQSDRGAVLGGITATDGLDGAHAVVGRLRARLLPPCTTLGPVTPGPTAVPGQNCRPGG